MLIRLIPIVQLDFLILLQIDDILTCWNVYVESIQAARPGRGGQLGYWLRYMSSVDPLRKPTPYALVTCGQQDTVPSQCLHLNVYTVDTQWGRRILKGNRLKTRSEAIGTRCYILIVISVSPSEAVGEIISTGVMWCIFFGRMFHSTKAQQHACLSLCFCSSMRPSSVILRIQEESGKWYFVGDLWGSIWRDGRPSWRGTKLTARRNV